MDKGDIQTNGPTDIPTDRHVQCTSPYLLRRGINKLMKDKKGSTSERKLLNMLNDVLLILYIKKENPVTRA